MTRPKLDRDVALGYLQRAGISLEKERVVTIGIRGGLETGINDNVIGKFDDLIAVVTPELCEGFTGNTDPSTEIPGRANLVCGIWRFKPGLHHPDTPNQYPAFVQAMPFTVKRYGQGTYTGWFDIHLHNAMGVNTTGSEGCQTIIKTEWDAFHSLLTLEIETAGVRDFPYLLADRVH